jgi:hypothetical protein
VPTPILATLLLPLALMQASPEEHAKCEAHANALFEALDAGEFDKARADFDTALAARYPATKIRDDYAALPSRLGHMMGRGRPHVGDMAGRAVVMAPMIFERGTVTAEVHCGADGAVTDLKLQPTQSMDSP